MKCSLILIFFICVVFLMTVSVKIKGGVLFSEYMNHFTGSPVSSIVCDIHTNTIIHLAKQVSEYATLHCIKNVLIIGNSLALLGPALVGKFTVINMPLSLSSIDRSLTPNTDDLDAVLSYYSQEVQRYPPSGQTGEDYRNYTVLLDYTTLGAIREDNSITGWNQVSRILNIKYNLIAADIKYYSYGINQLPPPTSDELATNTDRYLDIMCYEDPHDLLLTRKFSANFRIAPKYEPEYYSYSPHPPWDMGPNLPNTEHWTGRWSFWDMYYDNKNIIEPNIGLGYTLEIEYCIKQIQNLVPTLPSTKVWPVFTGYNTDMNREVEIVTIMYDRAYDTYDIEPTLQGRIIDGIQPEITHVYEEGRYIGLFKRTNAAKIIPPEELLNTYNIYLLVLIIKKVDSSVNAPSNKYEAMKILRQLRLAATLPTSPVATRDPRRRPSSPRPPPSRPFATGDAGRGGGGMGGAGCLDISDRLVYSPKPTKELLPGILEQNRQRSQDFLSS